MKKACSYWPVVHGWAVAFGGENGRGIPSEILAAPLPFAATRSGVPHTTATFTASCA